MKKYTPNNPAWNLEKEPVHLYAFWHEAFSIQECKKIIDIGKRLDSYSATVTNFEKDNKIKLIPSKQRDSEIAWLYPGPKTDWIFGRLTTIIMDLNEQFFKFDLFGFSEGCQFTHYKAPGAHYGKHIDQVVNMGVRKLSITLQLSDPTSYQGGELYVHGDDEGTKLSSAQGTLLLFPSYVLHEVKPVTKGERYSLVSWITGRPFK